MTAEAEGAALGGRRMADVLMVAGRLNASELRSIERLAGRLAMRGVAIRLLCVSGAGGGPGVIESPGLGHGWRRPWAVRQLTSSPGFDAPDLLHVVGPEMAEAGLALAERWGRPYLLQIVEFPQEGTTLRVSRKRCRGLIVAGHDLCDELAKSFRFPADCLEVIEPGIVLPDLPVPPPTLPARVPVVGTAASADNRAGLTTFFEAARLVLETGLDVEFVVAWSGPDESGLRRLAAHLGIKERVTLADTGGDDQSFWRVLDIYCQASLVPSSGRALATALTFAVPAVASDVPGLRSWVRHESTGMLVPPGDTPAFARTITELLSDPERGRRLGLQGRNLVSCACDPAREADLLNAAYARVIEESARPGIAWPVL